MLLSFAQFEREVSSERVRDKIRASKAKGFWTGGCPPLGYDIKDKHLIVNEAEAKQVRDLFNEYLKTKSISQVTEFAKEHCIKSKVWKTKLGKVKGGHTLSKSIVGYMLRKPIYIGKTINKSLGETYNGKHDAIIGRDVFKQVQETLVLVTFTPR